MPPSHERGLRSRLGQPRELVDQHVTPSRRLLRASPPVGVEENDVDFTAKNAKHAKRLTVFFAFFAFFAVKSPHGFLWHNAAPDGW
jgi:hypothetical protein